MLSTLWTSRSGMNATQDKLDAISNNIANLNTHGYKRVDVGFKDLLTKSLDTLGTPINDKSAVAGTGVRTGEIYEDRTQGMLQQTTIATDIAIDGEGYYRVLTEDGQSLYTRDGNFHIDSMGRLIDPRGNKLQIEYGQGYNENNVQFSKNNFAIDQKGNVFVKNNDKFEKVGEIPLYTAVGDRALVSVGENLYVPQQDAQVYRTRDNSLLQGYLEGSNVDVTQEFSDMIMTQRAFQLSSKGIQVADEMWQMANNLRR